MNVAQEVKRRIEEGIPGAIAIIRDFTGTGDHLEANIVWAGFQGLSRVKQQQKVFSILEGMIGDGKPIHAFSMKTWTEMPAELENPADAYHT